MKMVMVTLSASMESFLQLISALLIFALVLLLTYLTARWIGGYQKVRMKSKNLQVIESLSVGNNKSICLVKTGTDYLVVAVGKDEIHPLATLKEEQLTDVSFLNEGIDTTVSGESFQEILGQLKDKMSKK
ncbi:MAG: flagellar biosynthetic protein FliO [Agathobacter sp.]|nr:flagellar biosynthetic protein FliO [Agathobacter sp.]